VVVYFHYVCWGLVSGVGCRKDVGYAYYVAGLLLDMLLTAEAFTNVV